VAKNVVVVMDEAAMAKFVSWEGPVGAWTERLAKETVFRQRGFAVKKSGALAAGMHYVKATYARGIGFDAGSSVPYAAANDQGAKPHVIKPKSVGGVLTFFWPKVGRVVSFKSVNHPGNRAYNWAMRGLDAALRFSSRS